MNISRKIHQGAAVHYRVSVLDRSGRVVSSTLRKRNLVLDQGLNQVASNTWQALFAVAAVGTGVTPTKRDSGATTCTAAGGVVTASAGFFEAADVGRVIKFDTGEEGYVTAFTSATEVTWNGAANVPAAEGTVWYVNQTALTTETKRSNTYASDGGANGSTWSGVLAQWVMKRTFIFSAESGAVTYREVGWSSTMTAGPNLFGRDLLAGAGVNLVAGQQLKIEVELTVKFSPAAATAWANVIAGWATNGQHAIECAAIDTVNASGGSAAVISAVLEPSVVAPTKKIAVSNSSAPLVAITTGATDRAGENINPIAATYVNGSFSRSFSATYGVSAANGAIRSLFLCDVSFGANRSVYRVLLDANETKDSSHTLSLTFTLSWGRTLVN